MFETKSTNNAGADHDLTQRNAEWARKQLAAQRAGWVPENAKRKPTVYSSFFVTTTAGEVHTAMRLPIGWQVGNMWVDVVAWMDVPEPYPVEGK